VFNTSRQSCFWRFSISLWSFYMKKSLIALAVLAASSASFAQSAVNLYGVADVWFGSVKAGGVTTTKLDSGGVAGSRWGVKGSEDLGGGLKANFKFEQGVNVDSGSGAAGQAFSRYSYVGFSGGFGEVKLGKTGTAYDDIWGSGNSAFDTALSAQNGVFRSGDYNWNPANTIYYASPSMGGFSGAFSYSLGENKTASTDAGSITAINLQYGAGPLAAAFGYQTEKATGSSTATEFTKLNGSYNFGVAKLIAGYGRKTTGSPETTEFEIGADFPVSSALTLSGGFARSTDNAAAGDAKRTGYGFAALYTLSKRTALYGGFRSSKTDDTSADDVTVFAVGVNHTF
jgi:predicted porin